MSILERMKADLNEERKGGGSNVAMISTIMAEIAAVGKNNGNRETTDAEAIVVIKKMVKNNKATIDMVNESQAGPYVKENDYLQQFLPKEASKEEIAAYIEELVQEIGSPTMKDMGKIMGRIKERFNGNYDGKMVSTMVRQVIS